LRILIAFTFPTLFHVVTVASDRPLFFSGAPRI